VDALSFNGEQQPSRADARAFAVGAGVLHHDFVEPRLHSRVGFAALPVAPVMPFNTPRDPTEADLLAIGVFALDLGVGRRTHHQLLMIEPIENGVSRRFG
jgi:hypothetical protein